jgi:Domain of unknown function (DUF1905)
VVLSGRALNVAVENLMPKSIRFKSRIRYWDENKQAGLAVADIPAKLVDGLGGRRQMRLSGTLNDKPFTGATMLVRDGGFCIGVTKAALAAAGVAVGETAAVSLKPAPKR